MIVKRIQQKTGRYRWRGPDLEPKEGVRIRWIAEGARRDGRIPRAEGRTRHEAIRRLRRHAALSS